MMAAAIEMAAAEYDCRDQYHLDVQELWCYDLNLLSFYC